MFMISEMHTCKTFHRIFIHTVDLLQLIIFTCSNCVLWDRATHTVYVYVCWLVWLKTKWLGLGLVLMGFESIPDLKLSVAEEGVKSGRGAKCQLILKYYTRMNNKKLNMITPFKLQSLVLFSPLRQRKTFSTVLTWETEGEPGGWEPGSSHGGSTQYFTARILEDPTNSACTAAMGSCTFCLVHVQRKRIQNQKKCDLKCWRV